MSETKNIPKLKLIDGVLGFYDEDNLLLEEVHPLNPAITVTIHSSRKSEVEKALKLVLRSKPGEEPRLCSENIPGLIVEFV
jgi:hypothetical protein